jgi:hypothetical protein
MVEDDADTSRVGRPWADVAALFDASGDPAWTADRNRVDQGVRDPWGAGTRVVAAGLRDESFLLT